MTSSSPLVASASPSWVSTRPTTKSTTNRRTSRRNSDTVICEPAASAFFTTGYFANASSAGPVAAHTKSGPRMPATQKSRSCCVMFARISASTAVSQPARAAGRLRQTIQMEDARAADCMARVLASRSV